MQEPGACANIAYAREHAFWNKSKHNCSSFAKNIPPNSFLFTQHECKSQVHVQISLTLGNTPFGTSPNTIALRSQKTFLRILSYSHNMNARARCMCKYRLRSGTRLLEQVQTQLLFVRKKHSSEFFPIHTT